MNTLEGDTEYNDGLYSIIKFLLILLATFFILLATGNILYAGAGFLILSILKKYNIHLHCSNPADRKIWINIFIIISIVITVVVISFFYKIEYGITFLLSFFSIMLNKE